MASALQSTSPKVLANRGVPVSVHRLEATPEGEFKRPFKRVFTAAEEPVFDTRHVKLSNLAVADIEDSFGSLGKWQEGLRDRPFSTLVTTLAIAWADDDGNPMNRRAVGVMLNDGKMDEYSTAVGAAFMLANGVDPERVGKLVGDGVKAIQTARQKMQDEMDLRMAVTDALASDNASDSPSMTGSEPGADSAETLTSSGD